MTANSSYLFGNDSWGGWGPRYFFSFYTELGGGNRRRTGAALEAASLLVIVVFSVVANVAIAAAILRYREMRNVTNAFLLNLALADLVFALGAPLVAAARLAEDWRFGDTVCRLLPYSQFVCGAVLLWTLTLISVDRHRCIVVPPYRSRLTPSRAALFVMATWAFSAALFLPLTLWFHPQEVLHPTSNLDTDTSSVFTDSMMLDYPVSAELTSPPRALTICTLVFPRTEAGVTISLIFTIPAVFLACILPMTLLVYHYQRIFRKLLSTHSRWLVPASCGSSPHTTPAQQQAIVAQLRRDSELSFTGIVGLSKPLRKLSVTSRLSAPRGSISLTQHEELRLGRHVRAVRVLLLNVLLVLLMWLPITVIVVLIYVDGSRPTESPLDHYFLRSSYFVWALIIALLNTVVNPLLYGVLSENFRHCLARMWRGEGRGANGVGNKNKKGEMDGGGPMLTSGGCTGRTNHACKFSVSGQQVSSAGPLMNKQQLSVASDWSPNVSLQVPRTKV